MSNLSLGNGYYKSVAPVASNQECLNFRPNYVQTPSGVTDVFLLQTEGIEEIVTSEITEINRNSIGFLNLYYAVQGNTLYRMDRTATSDGDYDYFLTALGTVTGSGPVAMSINPTQICIVVPDGDAYIYTVENGLETITSAEFLGPSKGVIFTDGYFIFWTKSIVFQSALNDGLTFNGADFATAESSPDDIVACFPYDNDIMIFGSEVTERWQNTANEVGFSYTRIPGAIIDKGLTSQFAIVETEETLIFMGGAASELPSVWQSEGGKAWKIATPAIDDFIQSYVGQFDVFESAFMLTYSIEGSTVACLSMGNSTLCFDTIASGVAERPIWHRRGTFIDNKFAQWHVRSIVKVWNQLITADAYVNIIGIMSNDVFTEHTRQQIRLFSTENMYNNGDPIFINRVEVVVDAEIPEYDTEYLLALETSGDGGKTWDNMGNRSVGTVGQFNGRIVWDRLGRFDTMVMFRLRWTSDARMAIMRFNVYEELQ